MRRIPAPDDEAAAVFELCISRMYVGDLRARLTSAATDVGQAAEAFASASATAGWHLLPESLGIPGKVGAEEMMAVYTQRLVPAKSPGRPVYDRLLSAPPNGICPYCGQRVVATLDHYLPKSSFTSLVVVPMNLVPLCSDCNKAKGDSRPTCSDDQHPHPYFEDFDDAPWLVAEVHESIPPALTFSCTPPDTWDSTRKNRIRHHFRALELGALYAAHAAAEIVNQQWNLREIHRTGGPNSVRQFLTQASASYGRAHLNSWQSATFLALRCNDWFCDGGFDF